jgi:UDP-GlcNAc3NAcA epimerase
MRHMKKIVTVIGARPQFIKASVVTHALAEKEDISEVIVHTGQHFDSNMSDVFFSQLGIRPPAYNLGIHGGSHGAMTGRMIAEVEGVLLEESPDLVLVYGDTNSTLAGALAAVKLNIPIAHVEAGLRSFNMRMPEEINRIITDRIAHWHFAPTRIAMQHLRREGIPAEKIHLVGDVMLDAARYFGSPAVLAQVAVDYPGSGSNGYVLVTIHRAENTDDPKRMRLIIDALVRVSQKVPVIWPMHPRTRQVLENLSLLATLATAVRLIDPLGYLEMIALEKNAALIATDSGGLQKEAFFFGVPCITIREETEWVELVNAGWNRLVPPLDADTLVEAILEGIGTRGDEIQPYGDGRAAKRIANILVAG